MRMRRAEAEDRLFPGEGEMARLMRALDWSKAPLGPETVELAGIVNGAVEANRSLIDVSGLELAVALPASAVYLNADATRLTQVLSNLLHNACKLTPPGGGISLTADLATPPSDGRPRQRAMTGALPQKTSFGLGRRAR